MTDVVSNCRFCNKPLLQENYRIADGCPCNAGRGINHGLVPKDTCTCVECDPEQTGSTRYPPEVYQATWNVDALQLPRDRATINAWARSFYALDPDVHRIIEQHALLFTSCYRLEDGKHGNANRFCKQQMETLNIKEILRDAFTEFCVAGEAFLYADLDEKKGMWSNMTIQNPDFIIVKRSAIPDDVWFFLRPDENLKRLCSSDKPHDIEARKQIDQAMVDAVRASENIPLSNFNTTHLSRKVSPYEIRGTSVMTPLLDLLKRQQEHWTPEQSETIKRTLGDVVGLTSTSIEKDVLITRFRFLFEMFEGWLNKKILAPVCILQGFDIGDIPSVKFDTVRLYEQIMGETSVVAEPKESSISTAIGIGLAGLAGSLFTAYANSAPSVRVQTFDTNNITTTDVIETITQEATS